MATGIYAVTCRTAGCIASNYTLTLVNPGDLVVCGGCSQEIADVQPPLPKHEEPELDDEKEGKQDEQAS